MDIDQNYQCFLNLQLTSGWPFITVHDTSFHNFTKINLYNLSVLHHGLFELLDIIIFVFWYTIRLFFYYRTYCFSRVFCLVIDYSLSLCLVILILITIIFILVFINLLLATLTLLLLFSCLLLAVNQFLHLFFYLNNKIGESLFTFKYIN